MITEPETKVNVGFCCAQWARAWAVASWAASCSLRDVTRPSFVLRVWSSAVWLRAWMSPVVQCQPSTNGRVTRWATDANGAVSSTTPRCMEPTTPVDPSR